MGSWLFLVFILNSSYTASLSSMLTVQQLQPNVTDIQWLKNNNAKIGCDGDSFVRTYLEEVEKFQRENIINISSEYMYVGAFKNHSIAAAFLELPYQKAFLSKYCTGYSGSIPSTRFGGLGFVSDSRTLHYYMLTLLKFGSILGNQIKRHFNYIT